jgi:S-adenosylmethionine synthetase
MDVMVSELGSAPVETLPLEMVERKGLGHPDAICDALAEEVSRALSRFYLERFGRVLHHNVDKVLLCGGAARPAFGAGEIVEPLDVYICGRASLEVRGVHVPIEELAVTACRTWLRRHLRGLDPERHVRLHLLVRSGSPELVELFLRQPAGAPPLANDTAIGVGFAPLSELERLTLAVEQRLNSGIVKADCPALGEDVKVLGIRRYGTAQVTVACAIVGRHVKNVAEYLEATERARRIAEGGAGMASGLEVVAAVNTADDPGAGSLYLTVTGTSAESGDDGQTGRGNRANGLITPCRPMSLEAGAGKNPVNHPGRLYQVAAGRIAAEVVDGIEEVSAAECYLASRIGWPITKPQAAEVRVRILPGGAPADLSDRVRGIVEARLERLPTYWTEVLSPAANPEPAPVGW